MQSLFCSYCYVKIETERALKFHEANPRCQLWSDKRAFEDFEDLFNAVRG